MVRKQEKSDLTGLIKWNFQKVTFFFSHPLTAVDFLQPFQDQHGVNISHSLIIIKSHDMGWTFGLVHQDTR